MHRAGPNPLPSLGQETLPGALPSARRTNALAVHWLVLQLSAHRPHLVPPVPTSTGCCQPCRLNLLSVFTGGGMFYLLP